MKQLEPLMVRLWRRITKAGPDECWLWNGALSEGYGSIGLGHRTAGTARTHRLVLEEKIGRKLAKGEDTRHACHNRACNNPAHLSPGSRADNMHDAMLAGRTNRGRSVCAGEKHPNARLTANDVYDIRQLWYCGEYTCRQLAARFSVDIAHIWRVATGKGWRSV